MTLTLPTRSQCTPASRVTRSLLGYGVLAGPCYVLISLTQALTRPGFDLTRHEWSLLANGPLGWIQTTNLLLSGLMTIAASVGLRRALRGRWGPRLIAGYGVGLLLAGLFRADPTDGFPVGTPPGRTGTVSWHGLAHLAAAGIGFLLLVAACFVVAARFSAAGERRFAIYSRTTGAVFLAAFGAIAAGSGSPAVNLTFTAAVIAAWAWLSVLSITLYRKELS